MGIKVVCYCLIFLLGVTCDICWCKDIATTMKPTELIVILNKFRKSIKSGEFRMMGSHLTNRPDQAIRSVEEIKEILEEVWLPSGLGYEDEIIAHMRKKAWATQTEELICFAVNTGSTALNTARYRVVSFDRSPLNPLKGVGRYIGAGGCQVNTYDGQIGALETDSQFIGSEIYLGSQLAMKVLSFHLFGRSQKYIPPDAQVNLMSKTVDNRPLYKVQFAMEDASIKLLVDPEQEFVVRKEEHFIDGRLVFSASYKDFKKEDSILFPTDIKIEFHGASGLKEQYKFEVKEVSFNVKFPSDFFEVQRSTPPGQKLLPFSPIKPNAQ